jgi:glycosyltransferase involved in cell wall biosynthesis
MKAVDVSLIVCTRNRIDSLKSTIASFNGIDVPPEWSTELIVVDNGSTDGTLDFLRNASCQLPMRVLVESAPGLSRARNLALANARGRVLVWTDDDVIVDPKWLRLLAAPVIRNEADAVAGQIVIPASLLEKIVNNPLQSRLDYLASTSWMDWSSPSQMVGANMAFGAHVLAKVPKFDERLGAGPDSLGFHEEGLFSRQLLAAGFRLIGVPQAIVEHYFSVTRLDVDSVLQIAKKIGRSNAYMDWHWYHRPRKRFVMLRKLKATLKQRLGHLTSGSRNALEGEFNLALLFAYYDELARCSLEPRKYRRNDLQA